MSATHWFLALDGVADWGQLYTALHREDQGLSSFGMRSKTGVVVVWIEGRLAYVGYASISRQGLRSAAECIV